MAVLDFSALAGTNNNPNKIEKQKNDSFAEENTTTLGKMFADMPEETEEFPLTGGSNVEPTEETPFTAEQDSPFFDRLTQFPSNIISEVKSIGKEFTDIMDSPEENQLGTDLQAPLLTETLPGAVLSMAAFFSQVPMLMSIPGMLVLENLGLKEKTTAKEKQAQRQRVQEEISSLGGKFVPKTNTGKVGLKALEVAVRPIVTFVDSILASLGVTKEFKKKYPNVSDGLQVGGEIFIFGALPKIKNRIKGIENAGTVGSANRKMNKLLKEAEANLVKNPELNNLMTEYQQSLTKSNLSQKSKGFDGTRARPDPREKLQPETKEVIQPESVPKTKVIMLNEEGIPRATYQIENGKIKTVEKIGEKKTYQIDPITGKAELIEKIPGQRSVYQILNNESGSVDIAGMIKLFGKAPKGLSLLSKLGKAGISQNDLMLAGLHQYLKESGNNRIDWKEFKKVADEGGFSVEKEVLSNKDKYNREDLRQQDPELYQQIRTHFPEAFEQTKYGPDQYPSLTLPGFKEGSYKENQFIFQPDMVSPDFIEAHGFAPNTMAHSRVTDRTITIPGKVSNELLKLIVIARQKNPVIPHKELKAQIAKERNKKESSIQSKETVHVNEVQSDWHKKGGNEGYQQTQYGGELPDGYSVKEGKAFGGETHYQVIDKNGRSVAVPERTRQDAIASFNKYGKQTGVPNAPFKKTWPQMVMRDVISDAVARGKEGISWDTGKTQAERGGGKPKSNRDAIYDKTLVKFMKKESGVKPEKVETNIWREKIFNYSIIEKTTGQSHPKYAVRNPFTDNIVSYHTTKAKAKEYVDNVMNKTKKEQVWYVPITSKLKKAYSDSTAVRDAIDMLLAPLRNESGAITIPRTRKQLLENTTPIFRDNVRKFGKLAETAGVPLRDFLKQNDFSNKEIKQILKVSDAVKLDRPMASAKEMPLVSSKDFKITELDPGDVQVNIGKKANSNIKIGLKDLERFAQVPKLKSGGLVQGLTVPETFFNTNKSTKSLLHMKRARDKALAKDTKTLTAVFKDIEKTYSNKKLRKEAGALQISQGKFGEKAMKKMRVKVNPDAEYAGLNKALEPILQDGLNRMNEVRKMNGRKSIKKMEDFIAWFAEENFWRDVTELVGGDFNRQGPSLIHDSIETIRSRHTEPALDMGTFNHVTREGLRDGVKLELDPLVIAQRYMSELLPVIHYAELNSFIKEVMTKDLTLPNGKKINFSDKYTGINQGLAQELISWSNSLVGKSNSPLPHLVEKQLSRLRRSLTNATLVGNIRTTAIQLTALQTSFVERPGRTIQAGFDFMADLGRKKPKFNRDMYNSLPEKGSGLGVLDTSFSDATSAIGGTKLQKTEVATRNMLAWGMKQLDYVAREITARAQESELKQAVKEGRLSEKDLIEQVDSTVVRTQSSGARGEVAPIQRSELGKIMTLWQTFTIGHINWLAKEVLGVKNPDMTPGKTVNRVFRYVATMAILGYVFEDLIGIQAPGPAPFQSIKRSIESGEKDLFKIALETGKELSELIPFGSSIKFGSSVYGPVFDFINKDLIGLVSNSDIYNKDVLAKARKGDVKSIIKILEVTGKLKGVSGTAQAAKTARGLLRNESLMRAMIGRIYDENADTGGGRRTQTARKRRKL